MHFVGERVGHVVDIAGQFTYNLIVLTVAVDRESPAEIDTL